MTAVILKIILYVFLFGQIIPYFFLANSKKKTYKYEPYFYTLCTVLILCALVSISIGGNFIKAEKSEKQYIIELIIYASIELISYLSVLIVRLKMKK